MAEFVTNMPYKVMACLVGAFTHIPWPRGLMDKASDFGSEDCEFESRRGQKVLDSLPRIGPDDPPDASLHHRDLGVSTHRYC